MIDNIEIVAPITEEPEDTPNTLYRLSRQFTLSNGDFQWIRLKSLTSVTVISDVGE